MSLQRTVMAPGRWTVNLTTETPNTLTDKLSLVTAAGFGSMVFLPAWLDPIDIDPDGLLDLSVYTGIYRSQEGRLQLSGPHATAWLADEDGKGNLLEAPLFSVGSPLSNWVSGLTPPTLTAGTVTDPSGSLGWNYSWANDKASNPREALNAVCDWFTAVGGSTADPVEWEVTDGLKLNAGKVSAVYGSTPSVILTAFGDGRENRALYGVTCDMSLHDDLEDYTNRVLVADTSGTLDDYPSTYSSTPYYGPDAASLKMTRKISGIDTGWSSLADVAKGQHARFNQIRQQLTASVSDFCLLDKLRVGSFVWAWDPVNGIYDTANTLQYSGELIWPLKLRVKEVDQPVQQGMGVYLRHYTGTEWRVIDLTSWVEYETGPTQVTVGELTQPLRVAMQTRGIRG